MFQIFDCTGRAVGRPGGYQKHVTAQTLAERRGRIKTEIWTAGSGGRRLVYSIKWDGLKNEHS